MRRNRFLNLSKFRYPYAASTMVWATSFPASILASLGTPPNSFFASPLAIPWTPCLMEEPIVRFDESFAAIESPGFHPKGKQRYVSIHMVSFRGCSLANQAWQRRPFPLTETAKSNDNRGGWAKSSTTIEVIEPFVFAFSCIQFVDN